MRPFLHASFEMFRQGGQFGIRPRVVHRDRHMAGDGDQQIEIFLGAGCAPRSAPRYPRMRC